MPRPDPSARRLASRLLLSLFLALFGGVLAAAPRVGVLTMQPGEVFFERFGHNALVVDPGDGSEPTSYNFGYFDPEEPDFLSRFVAGTMRYRLVALPLAYDLSLYERSGRGVSVQWLDLDASEATALAAMLAVNARPENAVYDYRYFTDNCSTRVRDALDAATGNEIWKVKPAGPLRGAPTVAFNQVFVMTQNNQIHALNAADGAPLWAESGSIGQAGVFGVPSDPRFSSVPGDGMITSVSVRSGPDPAPLRFVILRQLTTPGFGGEAQCCFFVGETAPVQPGANTITTFQTQLAIAEDQLAALQQGGVLRELLGGLLQQGHGGRPIAPAEFDLTGR